MKRKIAVVVTSRASYARIKTALTAIRDHAQLELQLIVGASALLERYGSAASVMEQDGFNIAARIYMVLEGENLTTMAKTTGLGIMELATSIDNLKPHIILTVGDRHETIATAIAGSYLNTTVAHVQGGEITGSIDEKVRHAVTKLADYHFASTKKAGQNIIRMGEDPKTVYVTGCPSVDLAYLTVKADSKGIQFDPFKLGVGGSFDIKNPYLVVMQHPVTNEYEDAFDQIGETLNAVYDLGIPTFWFWPNVDAGSDKVSKGIRMFREQKRPDFIHFIRNLPPEQFLSLVNRSVCIVGNSSMAIRECSYLGVPAVNIGTRQQGRERGANVKDVICDRTQIKKAVEERIKTGRTPSEAIYGDGQAGKKIADLLSSLPLKVHKQLVFTPTVS